MTRDPETLRIADIAARRILGKPLDVLTDGFSRETVDLWVYALADVGRALEQARGRSHSTGDGADGQDEPR